MSKNSPKDRSDRTPSEKSGRPKASKKPEGGVPNAEAENPAPDNYREGISQSALNKSDPDSYRDEHSASEIKKMEVHHHPQLHHEKKPWKEYLLEGLMIFLAVTMGFFAESLREHISDREREKQYVHSLIEDLKGDIPALQNAIRQTKEGTARMDSLVVLLDDQANMPRHGDELYYFGRLGPRLATLSVSTRTFEQLKNSGGFRLISKLEVSNRIMSHYQRLDMIRQLEDIFSHEFESYKKAAAHVFEPAVFLKLEDGTNVKRSTDNPALQKDAGAFIKELATGAIYMNGSRKGITAYDEQLLRSTNELLTYLQQEYHLEDE